MAVPQDGSASTLSIPPRSSSLAGAGDATRLEQHSRSEQFFDSAYITWPAPRSRYLPPRRSSHDDVEPFPDFQDPSTSLIIARTLLLDHLYSFQRRAVPGTPFQSLHSRIVPSSGHIKEGEDLTRCRASVEKVLGAGQALRARRMQGSYGKPARLRGTDPNMCFGKKEAEPKQLMKMKLKTKVKNGIAEALRIERAFSRRAINGEGQDHGAGEERGRSAHRKHRRARAATPAAHTPKTVMKTLMMLRETYPLYYKSQALPVAASLDSKDQPARKSAEDEQQPTGLGVTLVPSLGHADSQPVLGSGREHLPALPCRSHKPLRTAASMTSLKSAKQTTKALLRRAAAKVGVCRSSASRWEEGTASWDMKSEEDKTVDLGRGKHTVHSELENRPQRRHPRRGDHQQAQVRTRADSAQSDTVAISLSNEELCI
ncbi:hypothetical protein A1O3_03193 [Capronia epimyces CBS 606.96]|uniref:Uncharacterized protein n=1 Tax=Capronia epimyces CBS 606.96 TaxID=1182542 RepID=W9Z6J5_9EURO|nr:uncharacterized protein A1O3_03193 [Capronia epimyces CBS 606.96]EXJ90124.1 hypothetical protein A1O3_03193 [Capronia epimyces CBS 606.96]